MLGLVGKTLTALGLHMESHKRAYAVAFPVVAFLAFVFFLLLPPFGFPTGTTITITEEATFRETARMLEEQNVIRSALVFEVIARVGRADKDIQAGRYLFLEPVGLSTVVYRLANGISGIPTVSVTFPEGVTARQMAFILKEALPEFDADTFITEALPYEGYLFPDTYKIEIDATPTEVIEQMTGTFSQKFGTLTFSRITSGRSPRDIVIMASLIEREARGLEDGRVISGILWNRIDAGHPLQVDAVFGYIKETATYSPSLADLEIDSPYNTYQNKGLPPGPISNPGLDSLKAALDPANTDYFYYLTGRDGEMRYAITFEEHKQNRALYLD
ncbi:endolytic transglycosylase MltG [Candidatus Parcubacteria bacterium]|nr:endolytic transglycosylase MltG [Candidatus Parcubacteria bacterium]